MLYPKGTIALPQRNDCFAPKERLVSPKGMIGLTQRNDWFDLPSCVALEVPRCQGVIGVERCNLSTFQIFNFSTRRRASAALTGRAAFQAAVSNRCRTQLKQGKRNAPIQRRSAPLVDRRLEDGFPESPRAAIDTDRLPPPRTSLLDAQSSRIGRKKRCRHVSYHVSRKWFLRQVMQPFRTRRLISAERALRSTQR